MNIDMVPPTDHEKVEMLEMVWAIEDLMNRLGPFLTVKEVAQLQAIREWLKARTAR